MLLDNPTNWLCDKIAEHSNYAERFIDGDFRPWVLWALKHRFIVMNNPPTYAIIARPVSITAAQEYAPNELLYCVDVHGDGLWMDFLWAPGQWPVVCEFLAFSGKKWGGWEHRTTGRVHIVEIEKLLRKPALIGNHY